MVRNMRKVRTDITKSQTSDNSESEFKPTSSKRFYFPDAQEDKVILEIMNTKKEFSWRLVINSVPSPPYSDFTGILAFRGYGVTTDYYAPEIPEFIPFRLEFGIPEERW